MKQETGTSLRDRLIWLAVAALGVAAVYGNHHFGDQPLLYRVLALLIVAAGAVALALQTVRGSALLELLKGANAERRRVVWPSRQERNQTTLVVLGFILVMALLLWGLDSLFGWLASLIMG
ncbi:MAG: preprotein translocase subunit SecE [Porticoccaceae bacterium]|nr:MAG: preprotein translocase subunit SecE [Porticoccaceae bacterium]